MPSPFLSSLAISRLARAEAIGHPFEIALQTYRSVVGYDASGRLLGVSSDGVRPSWPAGTTVREYETDAAALASRDRAMLELLYAGALRVSELATATLEDLKLDAGYMLVRGKGDKERIVPLGKPAQDALSKYLSEGRPVLAQRAGKKGASAMPASV